MPKVIDVEFNDFEIQNGNHEIKPWGMVGQVFVVIENHFKKSNAITELTIHVEA